MGMHNHMIPPPNMNHAAHDMHYPSARLYHTPYVNQHVQNLGMMQQQQHMYPMPNAYQQQQMQQMQMQQNINKVEGIVIDKDVNESKSEESANDIPPEIDIPRLRLSGEFMTLEEIIVDETVDECGSIIQFEHDTK